MGMCLMQIQIGAIVGKAQRLCFRWRRGRCGGNGRWLCRDVSHERRTSVTVLRCSLEVLCDGVIQEPKEVAQYHDSMLSETIHLQRMIGDLMDNAIKYSPKNTTVNLSLCGTASTCVITVSDSGPGVPEEELHYVFDRSTPPAEPLIPRARDWACSSQTKLPSGTMPTSAWKTGANPAAGSQWYSGNTVRETILCENKRIEHEKSRPNPSVWPAFFSRI